MIKKLSIKDLSIFLKDDPSTFLVKGLFFDIFDNKTLGIIGESGSGKTISMMAILNSLPFNLNKLGNIYLNEKEFNNENNDIIYFPQSAIDALNPSLTIKKHFKLFLKDVSKKEFNENVFNRLKLVNLDPSILKKYPFEISGGMAQKVLLALFIDKNPSVIIADEITSGLDETSKKEYLDLFFKVFNNSIKILITHDISLYKYCDDLLIMKNGKMLDYGTKNEVIRTLKHPYTKDLFNAINDKNIDLENKNLNNATCPYYKKCKLASNECLNKAVLNKDGTHLWWCNHVRN